MDTTVEGGTTYEVIVHREVLAEASFWVFEIPALGAVGQAMELSQVEDEARGIIAAWDEDSFTVRVRLDDTAVRPVRDNLITQARATYTFDHDQ